MSPLRASLIAAVVAVAGCAGVGDAGESGSTSPTRLTVSSSVEGSVGAESVVVGAPDHSADVFARLEVGQWQPVQIWQWCGVDIEVGGTRYVPDRELYPYATSESDFPPEWQVAIFNEGTADGPGWAILDAKVARIDESTLEVRHIGTDRTIAFLNEDGPSAEIMC